MGLVNSPKVVSPCRGFFFFTGVLVVFGGEAFFLREDFTGETVFLISKECTNMHVQ